MTPEQEQIMKEYQFLSLEQLEKLPTPRLLNYFKKYKPSLLYKSNEDRSDWYDRSSDYEDAKEAYYNAIKELLNKREHVS